MPLPLSDVTQAYRSAPEKTEQALAKVKTLVLITFVLCSHSCISLQQEHDILQYHLESEGAVFLTSVCKNHEEEALAWLQK